MSCRDATSALTMSEPPFSSVSGMHSRSMSSSGVAFRRDCGVIMVLPSAFVLQQFWQPCWTTARMLIPTADICISRYTQHWFAGDSLKLLGPMESSSQSDTADWVAMHRPTSELLGWWSWVGWEGQACHGQRRILASCWSGVSGACACAACLQWRSWPALWGPSLLHSHVICQIEMTMARAKAPTNMQTHGSLTLVVHQKD